MIKQRWVAKHHLSYLCISKGVGNLPTPCFWPDTTNCRVSYFIKPDRTIRSVSFVFILMWLCLHAEDIGYLSVNCQIWNYILWNLIGESAMWFCLFVLKLLLKRQIPILGICLTIYTSFFMRFVSFELTSETFKTNS